MLEITQQQIQDAEKQKQSLLNSVNQLTITNETNNNGHKQNSSDESDEDNENEQVSVAAGAAATTTTSDDTNKETNPTEPDPIERPRVMAERTPNPVVEVVSEDIFQVKIADLGNACWT
ncbi:unnamed protein product, partial [Adineta steineri]